MSDCPTPKGRAWEQAKGERNWLVYRLVPRPEGKPRKIPQTEHGQNTAPKTAACFTFEEAQAHAANLGSGHGIGYLPRKDSALVCVDFDGVLTDGEMNQAGFPEVKSYTEISPSGTGLHVLVERPGNIEPISFDDGNDWVGYLGSDSKFFTVTFDRWGECVEIVSDENLVTWALDRHERNFPTSAPDKGEQAGQGDILSTRQQSHPNGHWFHHLSIEKRVQCAEEMLAALPPDYARGYDTWLKVGMALKLVDEAYALFAVWDRWSENAPNYDGETLKKWDQFAPTLDPSVQMVTIATIISWAKRHGWDPSKWECLALNERSRVAAEKLRNLGAETPGRPEVPPIIQSGPRERAEELVRTYAFLPSMDRAVPIDDCDPQHQIKMVGFRHQNERWARRLRREDAPPNTNGGVINPVAFWLSDPMLTQIDGLAYRPDRPFPLFTEEGKTYKNYFAMPEHPTEGGDVAPFHDFMRGLVPDERERTWLYDHIAFKVQNPHLPQVAVVFVSEEGRTGRGTLADILQALFHTRNCGLIDADRLLGRNSQAAYKGDFAAKVILFCEELPSVGEETQTEHHRIYNRLKEVVDTRPKWEKLAVKYGQPVEMYTCTSFYFATNNTDALPLPEYDKRFVVLKNGPQRPYEFWAGIREWREIPSNIGALFRFLMDRDLSGYRHTEIIETEARARMVRETKYTSEQVTNDILADIETYIGEKPAIISLEEVVDRARREDAILSGRAGANRVRKALERLGYQNVPHADGFGDDRGRVRISIKKLGCVTKRHTVLAHGESDIFLGSENDLEALRDALKAFVKVHSSVNGELNLQEKAKIAGTKLSAVPD